MQAQSFSILPKPLTILQKKDVPGRVCVFSRCRVDGHPSNRCAGMLRVHLGSETWDCFNIGFNIELGGLTP